jgi:hypothetical protein
VPTGSRGNAQHLSNHINGGIVNAFEEGLDGVTVALAAPKTMKDCTGNVSEEMVAMLIDAKRSVRVPVTRQFRYAMFAIGLVAA